MAEETNVEKVTVDTTKQVKGTVTINKGWKLPTPTLLARSTKSLRYFCVFLIGTVSGSDYFSGGQSKAINFGLSVFIGFLGAVDVFVGVEPEKRNTVAGMIIVFGWYVWAIT